ncbi:MAG: MFS transporter [Candidatus Micrarchaeia archaeon]
MELQFKKFGAIFILIFFFEIIIFTIQFYFPILFVELGFDPFEIGFLISIGFLVNLLLSAPVGILCDRTDLRFLAFSSILIFLVFFFGMTYATEIFVLTILIFIFRLGQLLSRTSLDNIVLKSQPENKNKLIGNYFLFMYFGTVAGIIGAGYFLSHITFQSMFFYTAIILAVIAPLSYFLPKIKPDETKLSDYAHDVKSVAVFFIGLAMFFYSFHFGAENISYTLFLKENLGLDLWSMGLYMGFSILIMAFAALFFSRKINSKNVFFFYAVSFLLSGVGHIFMAVDNLYLSFLFRIIHEVGDAIYLVAFFIFLKDYFPQKRVGGSLGVFAVITTIGSILGCFLFSYIGFGYGHDYSLILSGILTLISALIIFIRLNKFSEELEIKN